MVPPDNKLLKFLKANYSNFTPSQKRIAQYVTQNSQECSFHTIDELAKYCDVNPSTLLRFCRDIGYSGYPQFQKALQQNLLDRLNHAEHSDYFSRPMLARLDKKSAAAPPERSLQNDIKILNKLALSINSAEIRKFSEQIINADKRYIICSKGSYGVGHKFCHWLRILLKNTVLLEDSDGSIYDKIVEIESNDILIAISGPRYSSRTIKFAQYIHEKKICPVISITDCQASPLYLISEQSLFYPNESISFLRSNIGVLSLINCIVTDIASIDNEKTLKRLEQYEDVFDYFRIIYKQVN